ncbi:MAG: transketolase [Thermosediminibacterales bacterium]|nr:transketolase [Thermosediminibacterales bacterium]
MNDINFLKKIALQVRKDIVEMTYHAGSGHPGGSLSAVEIMVSLYFSVMKVDPKNPDWEDRDRFVLSKGHACPVLYSVLARKGFFSPEDLKTLRKFGSHLQGHPSRLKTPGVEVSAGSLGQGLSVANGIAIGAKMLNKDIRVYCLMGDGEIQEGSVWEAAMTAGHRKLDNLVAIVDYNNLQIDGWVEDVKGLAPLADKWRSFRWHVIGIDGHDFDQILSAFNEAEQTKGCPTVILAETVKGKGISFMENKAEWHGKAPNRQEYIEALEELGFLKGGESID